MLSSTEKDKSVKVLEDYFIPPMMDKLSGGVVLWFGEINSNWGEIVLQRSSDRKQCSFRLDYEILEDHPNHDPREQTLAEGRAVEFAQTLIDSGEDILVVTWKDLLPE